MWTKNEISSKIEFARQKKFCVEIEFECHHDLEKQHQTDTKWTNRKRFRYVTMQKKSLHTMLRKFTAGKVGCQSLGSRSISFHDKLGGTGWTIFVACKYLLPFKLKSVIL
jgi:hypothetical protein